MSNNIAAGQMHPEPIIPPQLSNHDRQMSPQTLAGCQALCQGQLCQLCQDGVTLHLDQGLSNLRQQDMTHVILQTPQQTHFASDTSTHVMGHHLNQAGHLQHSDSPPRLALSVCCAATHHDNVPVSQDH